jgi:hypothetical protein
MKPRFAGICLSGLMAGLALPAAAEIVFLDGGQVASTDAEYAYQHPSLRSVVFVSPETRQMAMLPPAPIFLAPPPLLWRSPTAIPLYPPAAIANGLNTGTRPSNQDMANYNLQRAHGFSQQLYYRDTYLLNLGGAAVPLYGYGYGYGSLGPAYPPPMTPGFNQPARPSNQSMNIYHLDRAHRYSLDAYKK